MQRTIRQVAVFFLIFIIAVLTMILLRDASYGFLIKNSLNTDAARVQSLTEKQAPFDDFVDFFSVVAEKKGGMYAFDLMRISRFPFGLDQHLLGHTVGEILYQQEGIDGMSLCTQDFRNACSHTMVIGALLEFGDGVLPQIRDACHLAPGGTGAYTMCFHGLGHGVLAYNLYDMEKTTAMCQEFGTSEYQNREAVECFGGAIMEIIGGGGHDRSYWEIRREEYLNPTDPFGFCERTDVPNEFRPICYTYMTPFAFEAVGANMAKPGSVALEKTFLFCEKVPSSEPEKRRACFEGLGKEFIGIATGRDLILEGGPSEAQLSDMRDWCMLARPTDGKKYCIDAVVGSLYWGGEKPYEPVLKFCSIMGESYVQSCYQTITQNVSQYIVDTDYRKLYCAALPEEYQSDCHIMLIGNMYE